MPKEPDLDETLEGIEFEYGRCDSCDAEIVEEGEGEACPQCGAYRSPA